MINRHAPKNRAAASSLLVGIILALILLVAPSQRSLAVPTTQSGGEREFVGTINNTLKVRIRLARDGETLSGSYAYEKIGKSLRLEGKLYDEREFSIDEFDERGTRTGTFDGHFVTPDWIEGYWQSTSANPNKKQLQFSAMVLDGKQIPAASGADQFSGQYRRIFHGRFDQDPGTINVWLLKDGRYRVAGDALWYGPGDPERRPVHVGDIDGIFSLQGRRIFYKDTSIENGCSLTITFRTSALDVTEDNNMCGGVNVNFDGEYKKVGPPHS